MTSNRMHLEFDAISENEGLARVSVAAFATKLDPTMNEMSDIKVSVSEAVTNSIVHGYRGMEGRDNKVYIDCEIQDNKIIIIVSDKGCGIKDIAQALEPAFTTLPEEDRSGFGFTFMQMFMDDFNIESQVNIGTTVRMEKVINNG